MTPSRALAASLLLAGALGARIRERKRAAKERGVANADLDCDKVDTAGYGPFGDPTQFNATDEEGVELFTFHPDLSAAQSPLPVMIFSHGATAEWSMYAGAIRSYVSHGFVVVFPHINGAAADTRFGTLDPRGGFTKKGISYARSANADSSSRFFGKLDLDNMVLAGHSMGATATIITASELPAGAVKLAFAMHPGICGPWGPPPCIPGIPCSTWMPEDFEAVSEKMPVFLLTATNDRIFWPWGPDQAFGCFNKSTGGSAKDNTAFAQFTEAECTDDGTGGRYDRRWGNGGHDCPLKTKSPETQWAVVAAKLYAQLGGDVDSKCHAMLWGSGSDSLQSSSAIDRSLVYSA